MSRKGQFLAPWDCKNILDKIREATGRDFTILCERGVSFGYNNLVVDMLGIEEMKQLGAPVTIDATHAVQLPGADPRSNSASTGGRRFGVPLLAKAAVCGGARTGCSWNSIPTPTRRLCDGPSCLPLDGARELLATLKAVHAAVQPALTPACDATHRLAPWTYPRSSTSWAWRLAGASPASAT